MHALQLFVMKLKWPDKLICYSTNESDGTDVKCL